MFQDGSFRIFDYFVMSLFVFLINFVTHIRIMSNNTTAISHINKKVGLKMHECNKIAKENSKMQLNDSWIQKYTKLYVTTLVHQKLTYLPVGSKDKLKSMSPGNQNQKLLQLMHFSVNWSHHFMYIFLQFRVLTKIIKKICWHEATGILVFPAWSTQPWYW